MKPEATIKDFLNYHHCFRNGFTLAWLLIPLFIPFFNLAPTDPSSLCPCQMGEKGSRGPHSFSRPPRQLRHPTYGLHTFGQQHCNNSLPLLGPPLRQPGSAGKYTATAVGDLCRRAQTPAAAGSAGQTFRGLHKYQRKLSDGVPRGSSGWVVG